MYMFYHDVLGLKDVFAGHARWPRGALLSSDERHQGVELFKVDETKNQTPGFVHFGFSVKNIDAWIEKLKAWGVEIVRTGTYLILTKSCRLE